MSEIDKSLRIESLTLILLMLIGCGVYSFKGTLPPHIKSVAVPVFSDRTAEFNVQQTVTDKIRAGFIRENILRLRDEENSDSIIYGTILSIEDHPFVYKESEIGEQVEEYRLTLKVEVEWYDRVYNRTIFKKQFTRYSEYDPTGSSNRVRQVALEESVDQITEDIINEILASW